MVYLPSRLVVKEVADGAVVAGEAGRAAGAGRGHRLNQAALHAGHLRHGVPARHKQGGEEGGGPMMNHVASFAVWEETCSQGPLVLQQSSLSGIFPAPYTCRCRLPLLADSDSDSDYTFIGPPESIGHQRSKTNRNRSNFRSTALQCLTLLLC